MYCPLDPATRDTIRLGWKEKETQHSALQQEWERKSQEQAEKEETWKRATEQHEAEVARRIREEHEREEQSLHEWTRKIEQHAREFEEMLSREREQRTRVRENWEREVEERERHEEEERQKLHMFWGHVEAHKCITYATREYTAQLVNLPTTWKHRLDACEATPLEVHGNSYFPKTCEDKVGDSPRGCSGH